MLQASDTSQQDDVQTMSGSTTEGCRTPGPSVLVGEQVVPAAFGNNVHIFAPSYVFKMCQVGTISQQIISVPAAPVCGKPLVVNENRGRSWRVGPVFKVVFATVEQQGGAIGIEEHRRKGIVGVGFNQLAGGAVQQAISQGIGAQI